MSELIYGIHTIESLLKSDPSRFLYIYIFHGFLNKRLQFILRYSKQYGVPVKYCNRRYLNNKVRCLVHQGIIAKVRKKNIFTEKYILTLLSENRKTYLFLILDHIVDPRNLGACLRCAGAFGVDMVIVPRCRSVGINSGVVQKVASGIADKIPFVRVTNLVRTLQLLKRNNIWVVGTVLQREVSILQASLSSHRLAIVIGSEDMGMRFLTRKNCDELINIPMVDSFVSLNVSVATGIFLFETFRQRSHLYIQ